MTATAAPAPISSAAPAACGAVASPAAPPVPARTTVSSGGFWRRFWAYCIDRMLVGIVAVPLSIALGFQGLRMLNSLDPSEMSVEDLFPVLGSFVMLGLLIAALGWLYYALMESSAKQATLGKIALGLRVTDLEGRRISFARATARYFCKILSGLILGIGYLMAAFTEKKQALHDLIAGTRVVRGESGP